MMATAKVEIWIVVDATGDYGVGRDQADAVEDFENDIQAISDGDGHRIVKVEIEVPLPEIIELTGAVGDDEAPATLTVKPK